MSRCNVDFFDTKLNYVHHDSVETPGIDMDYLTPETSSFQIGQTNALSVRYLVRIEGENSYVAVVDNISHKEGITTVSVKPFLSILDQPVLFDCNWQYPNANAKPLEQMIGDLIAQYWYNSSDTEQNMPLNITTYSSTTNWSFGLVGDKSDDENATSANNHQCVVEFYDTILQNAMMRYRVTVTAELDIGNKRVNLSIGVPSGTRIIEADLPEVEIVDFTIGKMEADLNKLEIWNDANYTDVIRYYLHEDGTYNTDGSTSRIKPVKMDVISVTPDNDHTFASLAEEQAKQKFGDIKWKNYIELDVGNQSLMQADQLKIGQLATVKHSGQSYETLLTGKKVGDITTLIFGTIRVDLTKKTQLEASLEYTNSKSITKNSSDSSH